jgi:hypothetical protein
MPQSEIVETRICSLGGQWFACNVKKVGIVNGDLLMLIIEILRPKDS